MGILLKRHKNFPANSSVAINSYIILISLPSLVLAQFPKLVSTPVTEWELVATCHYGMVDLLSFFSLYQFFGKEI